MNILRNFKELILETKFNINWLEIQETLLNDLSTYYLEVGTYSEVLRTGSLEIFFDIEVGYTPIKLQPKGDGPDSYITRHLDSEYVLPKLNKVICNAFFINNTKITDTEVLSKFETLVYETINNNYNFKRTTLFETNLEEQEHTVVYKSRIDENFTVIVLYEGSGTVYERFKEINVNDDIALINLKTKRIVVDGEALKNKSLTNNHLLIIEAHEIAHSYLKHEPINCEQQEFEADKRAYELLLEQGYSDAAKVLLSESNNRHDKPLGI